MHLGFKHITHHRTIHIFGSHAVYTGSSDRPRLPCAVFCDDTHICGLPKCIYIISLTDNEGYVLAMNGFLLVRVRTGHRHMSLNQSSSSRIVRIPSHMLGMLGSTYIVPLYLVLNYLAFMIVVCIEK